MDALPVTHKAIGDPESTENKILETGAGVSQVYYLVHHLCACYAYIWLEFCPCKKNMRALERIPRIRS